MTENDSFTKNIPHATANVHKNKNGLESPFVVEMRGFVLAFRKTKMLVYAYVLLNASVIAKNDGCPPFF